MQNPPKVELPDGTRLERVPTELTEPPGRSMNNDPEVEDVVAKWQSPPLDIVTKKPSSKKKSFSYIMNSRLRSNAVLHLDRQPFWPPQLLERLFGWREIEQIVEELLKDGSLGAPPSLAESDPKTYWADRVYNDDGRQYRHILALLILVDRPQNIKWCMDNKLSDDALPLRGTGLSVLGQLKDDDEDWNEKEEDLFQVYQWQFKVQFLRPTSNGDVPRYRIGKQEIKPWIVLPNGSKRSSSYTDADVMQFSGSMSALDLDKLTLGGGFGEVQKVIIHPWQHDFGNLPHTKIAPKNIFALKRLRTIGNEKKDFEKETEMLRRFSGKGHNIVTLLATIIDESNTDRTKYHLLFPWAEGDLKAFWQKRGTARDHKLLKWVAEQCLGIVEAVAYIHDPGDEKAQDGKPLFGRHGDIKPENILWFRGETEVLVLSDLGIADVHRETSRSNQMPTMDVTREYRPPERDIKEDSGPISRSFDIWTLGCVFLEFMVWTLYGWEGVKEFQRERFSSYQVGARDFQTSQYFDGAFLSQDENIFQFKIKDQVIKRVNKFHNHEKCSQYMHDFLDLIQTGLLVVSREERIKAVNLRMKMEKLNKQCRRREYCLTPVVYEGAEWKPRSLTSTLNQETLGMLRPSEKL